VAKGKSPKKALSYKELQFFSIISFKRCQRGCDDWNHKKSTRIKAAKIAANMRAIIEKDKNTWFLREEAES